MKKAAKFLIGISCFVASISTSFANDNISQLARNIANMHQENNTSNEITKDLINTGKISYERISSQFELLNNSEKIAVVKMGKQLINGNSKSILSLQEQSDEEAIMLAADLLDKEGLFLGNLSEGEILPYFLKAQEIIASKKGYNTLGSEKTTLGIQENCSFGNFPARINKKDPGNGATYTPYYYAPVRNNSDELLCDWELGFRSSKNNVWGVNWLANQLLDGFNGGLNKRTDSGQDKLISGRLRTTFWLGTGAMLAQVIVIW